MDSIERASSRQLPQTLHDGVRTLRVRYQSRKCICEVGMCEELPERGSDRIADGRRRRTWLAGQLFAAVHDVQYVLEIVTGENVTVAAVGERIELGRDEGGCGPVRITKPSPSATGCAVSTA